MADIDIRRAHGLDRQEAKDIAKRLASDLGGSLGLSHEWQGDTLRFRGTGLDGSIEVEEVDVHVTVRLGFLLKAMKPAIEQGIHNGLDKLLQQA